MNTERHDISIKTSEEEGFDIYVLYYPSMPTRSATREQPEEFSDVEIEGIYYDDSGRGLSPGHMAMLPYYGAEWLDVKEIDWTVETQAE